MYYRTKIGNNIIFEAYGLTFVSTLSEDPMYGEDNPFSALLVNKPYPQVVADLHLEEVGKELLREINEQVHLL